MGKIYKKHFLSKTMANKVIMPGEYEVKLLDKTELYPGIKSFTFEFEKEFKFSPGQFVMFELKDEKGNNIRRSYSIASARSEKIIDFVLKIIPDGKLSQRLDKLDFGEKIKFLGPYGKFGRELEYCNKEIMMIATGTGIVPIYCIIENLFRNKFNHNITLIYGFRHETNFLFKKQLENLAAKHANFELVPMVSQPTNPERLNWKKGRVTDYITNHLNSTNSDKEFYICGFGPMVRDTKKILIDKGIKEEQVHIEAW